MRIRLDDIAEAIQRAMEEGYILVKVDGSDTITNIVSLVRKYEEATNE